MWALIVVCVLMLAAFSLSLHYLGKAQDNGPSSGKQGVQMNTQVHDQWANYYGWATFFQGATLAFMLSAIMLAIILL